MSSPIDPVAISTFLEFTTKFGTISEDLYQEVEENFDLDKLIQLFPKIGKDKTQFLTYFQSWINYQTEQLKEIMERYTKSSHLKEREINFVMAQPNLTLTTTTTISAKKKRLNPSQVTQKQDMDTNAIFSNTVDGSDLRKELLDKKPGAAAVANEKFREILLIKDVNEKLIIASPKSLNGAMISSPPSSSSSSKVSPAIVFEIQQYLTISRRVAIIYSQLVIQQHICISNFLNQFMRLLNLDFTLFEEIDIFTSTAADSKPMPPPAVYLVNVDSAKLFVGELILKLSMLFKCLGSIVLKNLSKYTVIVESKESYSLMQDMIESLENEFPSQLSLSSQSAPFQSFMRPTFTADDNRLEQKTKIEKDSYTEREKFYEDLSNLFLKYYDLYYRDYNGSLLDRFIQKDLKELIQKMNNTKPRNMKAFAKLILQMYLHYSMQMVNGAVTGNVLPSSSSEQEKLLFSNLHPNEKDKLKKLESRFNQAQSTVPSCSTAKRIPSSSTASEPQAVDFEGYLSFFSKFIVSSNHYLFYYYLLQLTLTEIELLISQKKYSNSYSIRNNGILSDENFIEQFTDVGVMNENEKNNYFLIKLVKLGQLFGFVYFLYPMETETATVDSSRPSSPNSPPASHYRYGQNVPFHHILERSFQDRTSYYNVLWILAFLRMIHSHPHLQLIDLSYLFKDTLTLLFLFHRSDKFTTIPEQLSSLEFLVILDLQEFWRSFPSIYGEMEKYSLTSKHVAKHRFHFMNDNREGNTATLLNETLIKCLFPSLQILLSPPTRRSHGMKHKPVRTIPTATFSSVTMKADNLESAANLHQVKIIKRQTPSIIQRLPSTESNISNSISYSGNAASFSSLTQSSSFGLTATQDQVMPPKMIIPTASSDLEKSSKKPKPLTPKISKQLSVDSSISANAKLTTKERSSSICPPSPATSVTSLANLSTTSNPSVINQSHSNQVTEKHTLIRATSTASSQAIYRAKNGATTITTSKAQKLNKVNLQQHDNLTSNQSNKSPLNPSPLVRQRSHSITENSLNSIRTQLFPKEPGTTIVRSTSVEIVGTHSGSKANPLVGTVEDTIIPNKKDVLLLQTMEHAFWQRHRYLYEVHVFLYSNTYRILQTSIGDLVNQSCQSFLKEFQSKQNSRPQPNDSLVDNRIEEALLQSIFKQTIEKSNVVFQQYYTTIIDSQLSVLYQHHSVPEEVKKLSIYYSQKQLYDLFSNRKQYFHQYCYRKLQQLIEKYLEMKQHRATAVATVESTNNNAPSGVDDEKAVIFPARPIMAVKLWKIEHIFQNWKDTSSNLNVFLSYFSVPNSEEYRSGDTRFTSPPLSSASEALVFISSFHTAFSQIVEFLYQLLSLEKQSQLWNLTLSSNFNNIRNQLEAIIKLYPVWTTKQTATFYDFCRRSLRRLTLNTEIIEFLYSLLSSYFELISVIRTSTRFLFNAESLGKFGCEVHMFLVLILPYLLSLDYMRFLDPVLGSLSLQNADDNDTSNVTKLKAILFAKSMFDMNRKTEALSPPGKLLVSYVSTDLISNQLLSRPSFISLLDILSRKRIVAFYENCKRVLQAQRILPLMSLIMVSLYTVSHYSENLKNWNPSLVTPEDQISHLLGVEFSEVLQTLFHQFME